MYIYPPVYVYISSCKWGRSPWWTLSVTRCCVICNAIRGEGHLVGPHGFHVHSLPLWLHATLDCLDKHGKITNGHDSKKEIEKMRRQDDVKMSSWAYMRCRGEGVKLWGGEHVKMIKGEQVWSWKMWRCEDVRLSRCKAEKVWRW